MVVFFLDVSIVMHGLLLAVVGLGDAYVISLILALIITRFFMKKKEALLRAIEKRKLKEEGKCSMFTSVWVTMWHYSYTQQIKFLARE